jgi:hypothetical protein
MLWHLLLSEQREQLGRQLLCCLGRQLLCCPGRQLLCCRGRQLLAGFAKARDRRQCRGKSRRQHKRTDYRGADHCYTPRRGTCPIRMPVVGGFLWATQTGVPQMMPGKPASFRPWRNPRRRSANSPAIFGRASSPALASGRPTSAIPRKRTQSQGIAICRYGPGADIRIVRRLVSAERCDPAKGRV